jgi:hypothetical protein
MGMGSNIHHVAHSVAIAAAMAAERGQLLSSIHKKIVIANAMPIHNECAFTNRAIR